MACGGMHALNEATGCCVSCGEKVAKSFSERVAALEQENIRLAERIGKLEAVNRKTLLCLDQY